MKTVYRYALEIEDRQEIPMPRCSQLLHVGVQNDKPYVWALVDTNERVTDRTILLSGTGHPIYDHDYKYVGTFMLLDGAFVGHVFG